MSRKNRERREANRDMETTQLPHFSTSLNRRALLVTGGIAAGTTVLFGLCESFRKIQDAVNSSGKPHDASIEMARKYGSVVFDRTNGIPERMFICLKQVHAGKTTIEDFRRNPERMEIFAKHHDGLRSALQEQFNVAETGKVHFFFESFVGEKETWGKDSDLALCTEEKLDEMLLDHQKEKFFLQMVAQILNGDTKRSVEVLNLMNGACRFASYCHKKNLNVVHGADVPGHSSLVQTTHGIFNELAQREKLTDAEVETAIQRIKKETIKDEQIRHSYISKCMQAHVPHQGIGVLVLGASHFISGANFEEDLTQNPIEQVLSGIPNSRTVVIDEFHLPSLFVVPTNTVIMGRHLKPEYVRQHIRHLRQNK